MGKAASAAENAAIPIPPAGTFSLFCPAVIDENLFELPNYKANSNSTHNYEDNRVFHDLSSFCRAYDGRLSGALMPWWIYVAAYFDACIVGGLVVAVCLYGTRWLVLKKKPDFFDLSAFLGGAVERAVALTLVLWAPPYLPSFIGGWVLLKFAIGWQREGYGGKGEGEVATGRFLALIGNVLSFAWAIFVGALLNPAALDIWAKPHG